MAWNWPKEQKFCLFWAFNLIFSLQHNYNSQKIAASDSEGFVCDFKIIFGPIVAAACMLDGETTLLNTELGQPLPLHSEIWNIG